MSKSYCPRLGENVVTFTKPSRKVHTVFLHCSATSNPSIDANDINDWHVDRGWTCIGYHYFMSSDGVLQYGRDIELTPAAQSGHNTGSIAICLNGLVPSDFTQTMLNNLKNFCMQINGAYRGIRFRGHKEVAAKSCPVYDYRKVLSLNEQGYMSAAIPESELIITRASVSKHENDRHPHVLTAQGLLTALSPVSPGTIDGIAGNKFEQSVKAFQNHNDLIADGIVGASTWQVLEAG